MGRRRFDHLVEEISVAAGQLIPRYELWMRLHELGWDPEQLTRDAAVRFAGDPLTGFLADLGLFVPERARRRLERAVRRYDPAVPTPYEQLARL
jgi:hypothetical protein